MGNIITDAILKARARAKKYRDANKQKCLEASNKWRNENKERCAQNRKKLYDANIEEKRLKRREYYADNREREIERAKDYQREHAEETKQRKSLWYEGNKDKNRTYSHNRRARVRNVEGGHFTDNQFQNLCNSTGNKCLRCGCTDKQLTADHVIPLGPPHSDEIENIQPLCLSCNSKKGTKTIDYRKS